MGFLDENDGMKELMGEFDEVKSLKKLKISYFLQKIL